MKEKMIERERGEYACCFELLFRRWRGGVIRGGRYGVEEQLKRLRAGLHDRCSMTFAARGTEMLDVFKLTPLVADEYDNPVAAPARSLQLLAEGWLVAGVAAGTNIHGRRLWRSA
jgi:hypothetical protein